MYLKDAMFVLIGSLSLGLIIVSNPSFQLCLLLGLVIWSFCRAYYFAFYVIEHYIDPSFKFSGLFAAFKYVVNRTIR
jgi:hypothetical protein